jgi:ribosomal protein S18 acetylase RimI-like enzyme
MTTPKIESKVRPIAMADLDSILNIDRKIRSLGKAITYADRTTAEIITAERKIGYHKSTSLYLELVYDDTAHAMEMGLVADLENQVRGFVLGRIINTNKHAPPVGQINIIGVDPDYQHRGIATQLVNNLCDVFRSRSVKQVQIGVDIRDKELLSFMEHIGFSAGHLIEYTKTL